MTSEETECGTGEAREHARALADSIGSERTLHTATLTEVVGEDRFKMLHVCHATDPDDVRKRLAERFGWDRAARATVRLGIDATDPVVLGLLPSAAIDRLAATGDLGEWRPLATSGDLNIVEHGSAGGASGGWLPCRP